MTLFRMLVLILLCISPASAQSQAAAPTPRLSVKRLEDVRLLAPVGTPKSMIVYLSDRSGWDATDDSLAGALRDDGSIVLGVDLSTYAKALDEASGVCLYVVGEITDLSQTAQRQLGVQTYLPPIVAGRGEGATFAYAALADAPVNTLGGAVAMGFANRLTLRLPFCRGATAAKTTDGAAYRYAFDRDMPEPAKLFVSDSDLEAVTKDAAPQSAISVEASDTDDSSTQLVQAVSVLADAIEPFGSLSAIDLPATTAPKAVAIFVSGDGGWRDIDKTMGEWFSTQGIHVIGVDALHYFWSKRTPEELAADVTTLIGDVDPDGRLPVLLLGYSFGADTLPFAYPLLPKPIRDRTRVIGLLAAGKTTSFQVTISGWLGIDDAGYDIPQAIAALPADRVLCIYGRQDDDSSCPDLASTGVTVVGTDGGHHFDGDYHSLADKILHAAHLP